MFSINDEDRIHKTCLTENLENVKNKDIVLPLKRFDTGEHVKSPSLSDESLKSELFSVSVCDYGIERIWLHISESHDKNKKLYTFGYYEAVELANNMEAIIAKIQSEFCTVH